ncbi:conjugal transfer protein TraB [Campylobacter jejuni]|nr:conjugal transfer protein TraB [Campylobacter jejuni]
MKNPFIKFFSNDKSPIDAQKTQNKNKVLIFTGIFVIAGALLFLVGGGDKKESKEKVGNFNLVQDDPMAKTRWVGEASNDLTLAKKRVDNLDTRNEELSKQVSDLKKIITDMKKENDANKRNYELNLKNIQEAQKKATENTPATVLEDTPNNKEEDLYKNFPQPNKNTANANTQKPSDYGLTHFGDVPELNEVTQTRYTPIQDSLSFTNIAKPEEKEKVEKKSTRHVIPTGSIVKAVLLSGMDAPTMTQAKTEPLPVLMKVTDLSILPNRWGYDVNECFLMGEGYGDLTSERAYIRVNNISCVTNKGQKIDMAMKGAATGEDGKLGLRGEVVTKQGALLARTLIAGFLQGVGEGFANQNQIVTQNGFGGTTTTNSDMSASATLQAGAFKGFSKSAEKLADFYLKMADQVSPVIEIAAGREINIITTATLELKTLEEQQQDSAKKNNNKK